MSICFKCWGKSNEPFDFLKPNNLSSTYFFLFFHLLFSPRLQYDLVMLIVHHIYYWMLPESLKLDRVARRVELHLSY